MVPDDDTPRPGTPQRPLRKDAARNRERLLEASRAVFARRGLGATLDDIARHAGVGVGTMYRRFPNKEALVEALFEDHLERMVRIATDALEHEDPWEGFAGTLVRLSEEMVADRGLQQVALSGAYGRDRIAHIRERFVPAIEALVVRAQEAGALRPDVRGTDLPLIQHMVGSAALYAHPVRPGIHSRYLMLILDGLRARPDRTPLTEPALSQAELESLMTPAHRRTP